jgi:hypothetical protein
VADLDNIYSAKLYLRRKYAADPSSLKQLADQIAACAFDAVTLTGQAFEGGSHSGQVTFPRLDYLRAIEEVIAELDTSATPSPATATSAYYRFTCPVG